MNNSSLSTKAMLVHVTVSQWTARKLDKTATETVRSTHGTDKAVGAYRKKLLPNAPELELVATISSQVREYVYLNTLPWMDKGTRILPSARYNEFTSGMRKMRGMFEQAVSEFISAYPRLKVEAKRAHGSIHDPSEYPGENDIGSKFGIDVSIMPMPDVRDFRVEVSEQEKREFLENMRGVESKAMRDCWTRLHEVVKKAAERLSEPDARFQETLISNITDICAILPSLNISDDPNLEASRSEVEAIVANLSVKDLRDSVTERDYAAKRLAEIDSKMSAFMGVI